MPHLLRLTFAFILFFGTAVVPVAAQDLILHLDFEEGAGRPLDQSSPSYTVSVGGVPSHSSDAAVGNYSMQFDAAQEAYLEVMSAALATEEVTVDLWLKPDSINGGTWIINKYGIENPGGNFFARTNYGIIIHNPNGVIGGVTWDTGRNGPTGGNQRSGNDPDEQPLQIGVWQNAIFVANADTQFFQLRDIDGNLMGEGGYEPEGAIATNPDQPLRIAKAGPSDEDPPRFFHGRLDDIRVYNYARIDASGNYIPPSATSSEPVAGELPGRMVLHQNYPNPFNPVTRIRYDIAAPGQASLTVFDILGREVATLVDGVVAAGSHEASFDGRGLTTGLYVYRLSTESGTEVRTMVLTK